MASDARPTLCPATFAPASSRLPMLISWISYASTTSRSGCASVGRSIAVADASACARSAAICSRIPCSTPMSPHSRLSVRARPCRPCGAPNTILKHFFCGLSACATTALALHRDFITPHRDRRWTNPLSGRSRDVPAPDPRGPGSANGRPGRRQITSGARSSPLLLYPCRHARFVPAPP